MTTAPVAEDLEAREQAESPTNKQQGGSGTAIEAAQRETVDGHEFLTVPVSLGRISLPDDD